MDRVECSQTGLLPGLAKNCTLPFSFKLKRKNIMMTERLERPRLWPSREVPRVDSRPEASWRRLVKKLDLACC